MVIAALIVFGTLLAAWILAPAERAGMPRAGKTGSTEVITPITDGLAEAA